eukprot:12918922-Prorocentrum_lima.AAC.1
MPGDGVWQSRRHQIHQFCVVRLQLDGQVRQIRLCPQPQFQRRLTDMIAEMVAQHLDHILHVAMPVGWHPRARCAVEPDL